MRRATNWFVSSTGIAPFRIELCIDESSKSIQLAIRYEYLVYPEWEMETDAALAQARAGAMEAAARRGRWQDVLSSLSDMQKWGPKPRAEMLGLGVEACANCNSEDDGSVWQQASFQAARRRWKSHALQWWDGLPSLCQALLLLDQMWASESPGVSPSRKDWC